MSKREVERGESEPIPQKLAELVADTRFFEIKRYHPEEIGWFRGEALQLGSYLDRRFLGRQTESILLNEYLRNRGTSLPLEIVQEIERQLDLLLKPKKAKKGKRQEEDDVIDEDVDPERQRTKIVEDYLDAHDDETIDDAYTLLKLDTPELTRFILSQPMAFESEAESSSQFINPDTARALLMTFANDNVNRDIQGRFSTKNQRGSETEPSDEREEEDLLRMIIAKLAVNQSLTEVERDFFDRPEYKLSSIACADILKTNILKLIEKLPAYRRIPELSEASKTLMTAEEMVGSRSEEVLKVLASEIEPKLDDLISERAEIQTEFETLQDEIVDLSQSKPGKGGATPEYFRTRFAEISRLTQAKRALDSKINGAKSNLRLLEPVNRFLEYRLTELWRQQTKAVKNLEARLDNARGALSGEDQPVPGIYVASIDNQFVAPVQTELRKVAASRSYFDSRQYNDRVYALERSLTKAYEQRLEGFNQEHPIPEETRLLDDKLRKASVFINEQYFAAKGSLEKEIEIKTREKQGLDAEIASLEDQHAKADKKSWPRRRASEVEGLAREIKNKQASLEESQRSVSHSIRQLMQLNAAIEEDSR